MDAKLCREAVSSAPEPLTRMRSLPALLAGALAATTAACTAAPPPPAAPSSAGGAPALVVLVVVDQLRGDLLDHYAEAFTGGFQRLREEGFRFTSASHNHAVTETAAGHATLATGVPPSRHGIVGNDWRVPGEEGSVYALEDTTSPLLGLPEFEGRSPVNVAHTGLADWVLSADEDARVVSVSKKDRSAIAMGGKDPDAHVYWLGEGTGRFVTSTWYEEDYPGWVERFNAGPLAELYADSVWESSVPARLAHLAGPDTVAWESGGEDTAFPHLSAKEASDGPWGHFLWVDRTPVPDEAVLRFGLAAMDALELGQRGTTDMLALSFSQTDYVGHDYGPFSREQLDNLLRLDRRLATLFEELDRRVGEGRWVLALSADHGTLTAPELLRARGEPGYRITREDLQRVGEAVRGAIDEGGGDEAVRERVVARVEALPHVVEVYRRDRLEQAAATDSFAALYLRSSFPGRLPGLLSHLGFEVRWEPGTLAVVKPTGTTHVGPYWTDRWVPLVFMGAGVAPGASDEAAYTYDVAPSLAALAGIPAPADVEGRPLVP